MDGWNTSFLLAWPIFRGELLVSGAKWCISMPLSSDRQVLCQPPPAKLLDRQPLPLRLLPLSKADSRRMFLESAAGRKPSIAHRSDQSFWRHCSEQWGRDKGECHQASGGRSSNANLQWAEWGVQRQPHWSTAWGITPSELQQKSWSCWLRMQKQKWRRGVDVRGYQTASDQTSCRGRPRHDSRWG